METSAATVRIRESLEQQYGAEKLWQVKQLGKRSFRAWLTDGTDAVAMLLEDGSIKIWELGD